MSDTSVTIEIEEPYAGMIQELRDGLDDEQVDTDLKQLIHDAVHNSYQELISEQS
jgi:hypothetical protein